MYFYFTQKHSSLQSTHTHTHAIHLMQLKEQLHGPLSSKGWDEAAWTLLWENEVMMLKRTYASLVFSTKKLREPDAHFKQEKERNV